MCVGLCLRVYLLLDVHRVAGQTSNGMKFKMPASEKKEMQEKRMRVDGE